MKKNLIILIFTGTSLLAQAQGETRIGIKAGLTSANLFGPDIHQLASGGSPSSLSGFHAGVFVNSKLTKNFWLKSELLYNHKNTSLPIHDKWGQQYSSEFKSHYIDLYPFSPTLHIKGFQVLAGPYVSMLLNASFLRKDSLGNSTTAIFGNSIQNSNYRQKLDAGFVLGAEYELKWGICIGVRYTHGFVPVIEDAAAVSPVNTPEKPQQKIYNKSLSISVGYVFGKKKKAEVKTDPLLFKHQ
ncbi:MAG: PorT family protein [Bacteroidetes bacterium]|nr:PorT family protein [Bacteroidota bacterium]MBS1541722.1 PorT family protein [Bacteroidota bacterium]